MTRPPLYGLDIVTDTGADATTGAGQLPPVDPATDRIVAVGVSLDGCARRFEGDEAELLGDVDEFLADLPPGVLVSWQGGIVDLPVLAARARLLGVATGLRLRRDARDTRRSPVAGVEGACCAAWHHHRHLDLARVYEAPVPRALRVRRVARVPEDLIPPADELCGHDPRHDAHLARSLAERRWSRARRLVDRMPPRPGAGPRPGDEAPTWRTA